MKNLIVFVFLLLCWPAFASELQGNFYAGAAATQVDIDEQSGNGEMLYLGWAMGDQERPNAVRAELQAEQYDVEFVSVEQIGMHMLGAFIYTDHHQLYLDLGLNSASFEAFGAKAREGFVSYGLGYRLTLGNLSLRASYSIDHIDEVDGIQIDRPRKTIVGLEYIF